MTKLRVLRGDYPVLPECVLYEVKYLFIWGEREMRHREEDHMTEVDEGADKDGSLLALTLEEWAMIYVPILCMPVPQHLVTVTPEVIFLFSTMIGRDCKDYLFLWKALFYYQKYLE